MTQMLQLEMTQRKEAFKWKKMSAQVKAQFSSEIGFCDRATLRKPDELHGRKFLFEGSRKGRMGLHRVDARRPALPRWPDSRFSAWGLKISSKIPSKILFKIVKGKSEVKI